MSLPLVVLIAKGLVEHAADLHHYVEILVGQDVSEIDHSVITDQTGEVHLVPICFDCNCRREDQREQSINHGHSW